MVSGKGVYSAKERNDDLFLEIYFTIEKKALDKR